MTGEAALSARVHRIVDRPGPSAEAGGLIIAEGLVNFVARVHDEWAVLGDGFSDRTALQQEQFGFIGAVLKCDCARIEFHGAMLVDKLFVDPDGTSAEKVDRADDALFN